MQSKNTVQETYEFITSGLCLWSQQNELLTSTAIYLVYIFFLQTTTCLWEYVLFFNIKS